MSHQAEELLGAYALGALDSDEQAGIELHLEGCRHCRAVLEEFRQVADGLLHAVSGEEPPAELRDSLIDRLAAMQRGARAAVPAAGREQRQVAPIPAGAGGEGALAYNRSPGERSRRRWWHRLRRPQAAWAALGLALAAANLYLLVQVAALSRQSEALLSQQRTNQTALAVLSYPESQVASLEGETARGSFVFDDQLTLAVINVWGLPTLDSGQAYQLWLIDQEGNRSSGGLLAASNDSEFVSKVVWSPVAFRAIQRIGITVEPAGGSPSPTGSRVLAADLPHLP